MRRSAVAALVMVVGLGGGTLAFASGGAGPVSLTAAKRTYAEFGTVSQYKPATLIFGAHEEITGLSWSTWRPRFAQGSGTYQVDSCVPNCAEGTITPTPATLFLSGREACGKRFIFRRLKVLFGGRKTGTHGFCPTR